MLQYFRKRDRLEGFERLFKGLEGLEGFHGIKELKGK